MWYQIYCKDFKYYKYVLEQLEKHLKLKPGVSMKETYWAYPCFYKTGATHLSANSTQRSDYTLITLEEVLAINGIKIDQSFCQRIRKN